MEEETLQGQDIRITSLTNVLLYHVLPNEVFSASLVVGMEEETLQGQDIRITSLTPPTINDASEIIEPLDVAASNGVIHTLDAVLLPPQATPLPSMEPTRHHSDAA